MPISRRLISPEGRIWEADEIAARIFGATELLARRGIEPGSRVMMSGANSPQWVVDLLALIHLDASVVLADHRATPAQRSQIRAQARVVLEISDGTGGTAAPRLAWNTAAVPDVAAWARRQDAAISWSSGTTGSPKGIVRSGRSILDNLALSAERMGYRPDDVFLPVLPYSHQYGLSLVLCWWLGGGTLVIYGPTTRLDRALAIGVDHGLSIVDGAPSTYYGLLNLLDRRPALANALETVRAWCVGGAPLGRSLAARFHARTGRHLLDGYGATEVGNIALAPPADPVGCGTPLPGVVVEVHDDDGRPLPNGRLGELVVRSDGLMTGHLGDDGEIIPVSGPVHRTGDIGLLDDAGRVFPVGRKHAVHRDGHTLYPDHLAERAESAGAQTEVVAVPDERLGCRLVFVIADPDDHEPAHWKRVLRSVLARYEQPDHIVVLPTLPLTSSGKPNLAVLEKIAMTALPASHHTTIDATVSGPTVNETDYRIPFANRVDALRAVRRYVADNEDAVLRILTEISPHQTASAEIRSFLATLDGAEEEIHRVRPGRVPQTAVFMPSNIPLYSYALYMLVASLYSDQITFRPSSEIKSQMQRLHALLAPVHGLPIKIFELSQRKFVTGPVREADLIVFTGNYSNAETIREGLAEDQLFLFFGRGINPFVIAPDADLAHAAHDVTNIRLYNSGQDCFGPDVVFTPKGRTEEFVDTLSAELNSLRFGQNSDPVADYGPIYYDSALVNCSDYLVRHARHIRHGGRIDLPSRRIEPTVLLWDFDDKLPLDEMFAPVFNVVAYPSARLLRERLSSPYFSERALGAMVYGNDPETVNVLAKRHQTCVNHTLLDAEDGNRPFGGFGMRANYISYGDERHAEPLLMSQAVAQNLPAAAPIAVGGK
ncbi:aldehyde dehydrogenase family protein [Streptomyces olivoreticuli]|uniref:aldehyde dehydrogenase family protein n=1 Tax=Streptomyces olivoreticuli TaxID=68246 RepID=UPI002658A30D|nr:aldehyde dehydrogenase family protein [Streptomyces olivoreticuli]WKK23993.1 aldehyde dehydrogenase family protein [Streptomyces olivoreticuli]